jgi:catechol 2,3-dioxygenase-like lactoylglutathione lyase family enzyme
MLADGQVAATLAVSDMDRARKFYTETLGFKVLMDDENMGTLYGGGKGTAFLVYWSEFAGTNKATAVTINVEDFDASVAELREKGITFMDFDYPGFTSENGIVQTPVGPAAWFSDPDGNVISVGSMPSPM